jgi:5-hydroxyisourate hydrolase-like protein (transthyretin family)
LFTPQQLIANNWTNGNISQPRGEQWFYFTAIAYTQYIHISFDTLNDVWVSVYTSSGTVVGGVETNLYGLSGSTKNFNKTITNGQGYYIKVRTDSMSSGTYKIAFNTSTTAPN